MKVIYSTDTNEVVGTGSDNIVVSPPMAAADPPADWAAHPAYFFHWNGVDAIELKTGAEYDAAVSRQKAEKAQHVIDKHAREDSLAVVTIGKFEENGDISNQVLMAVLDFCRNGTPIPDAIYDKFVVYFNKVAPYWCIDAATMSDAKMDEIAAAKAKARANAQAIVTDPDWPYTP